MTEDTRSLSEEIAELKKTDEPRRGPVEARKKAMDLLARREHARGELLSKLEKAGFESNVALDAILTLESENLQSDARFAEAFVRSRFNQGKGPVRIRQELRERDVAAAVIDAAFSECRRSSRKRRARCGSCNTAASSRTRSRPPSARPNNRLIRPANSRTLRRLKCP